jgi:hypothetical protein
MKKILMVAITLLALSSCLGITKQEQDNFKEDEKLNVVLMPIKLDNNDISICIYDSCEYIGFGYGQQNGILTHKGNCKFCLKRNSK